METVNQAAAENNGFETVNQAAAGDNNPGAANQEKLFTQAELDGIFNKRYGRLMAKYNDYDELKEKAEQYDELAKANEKLKEAAEGVEALKLELDGLKKADEIRVTRDKVAKETGVPAGLLTGETEDACKEQAQSILAFARPEYPNVKDGGEIGSISAGTTKEQFAEWANTMIAGG